jgi:hypothetical protein
MLHWNWHDDLLSFIGRIRLRTANVVEPPFAAVRLRMTAAQRFKKVDSATAMIWKVLQVAEKTFRRLNAPELLPAVYAGAKYVDGIKQSLYTTRRSPPDPICTLVDKTSSFEQCQGYCLFVDSFRTLCVAPTSKMKAVFDHLQQLTLAD